MIKRILLKGIAPYEEQVEINDIKKINFFYGGNGSGKTVLSKVIANPDNNSACKVEWENNSKLKTVVFNEDFVRNYFYESEELDGIYTIGEGAGDIEDQIKTKKEERTPIENNKISLDATLRQKNEDLKKINDNFIELCWKKIYQKYQNDFKEVFVGYRNSKQKFSSQLLNESSENHSQLQTKEYLTQRYDLLYKEELKIINELNLISNDIITQFEELESNEILRTKIIGKKDVDIASMIEKLHNHDWVRQGKQYYELNYNEENKSYICPFCQQATPDNYKKKLEEYFDETYENQIQELVNLIEKYKTLKKELTQYFDDLLLTEDNKYFESNKENIKNQIDLIKKTLENNVILIEGKKEKPSEDVKIQSILELINKFNNLIADVNNEIKKYTEIFNNQKNEKEKLNSEIWKYFCNEIKTEIEKYNKDKDDIEKAIDKINKQIGEKNRQIEDIKTDISKLEKQIKSVRPTVERINMLLERFGFRGFKLDTTEDDKHYRVIREDGKSAKKTLSEGERNFIVFLYFYHLIQGALNPDENITESKIVVFDDPVSSLDSDVLFIEATLIKDILRKIRSNDNNTNIKQVFILTHNTYFFKEITFISSRDAKNVRTDTGYHIIRKVNNKSNIKFHETNPIKTTYQLLWEVVKNENADCICLQNSMRRIIEFYFNTLADLNEEELLGKFKDQNEHKICRSLISWMNVGSHDVFSSIDYSPTSTEIDNFKNVFKSIFCETGHSAHYNMMMGSNDNQE
ncbi:hypothetical protein C0T31_09095 [Dysgonamonadaceae bacterium]|nr:hypothetical protein C0T31_09095 [Dysgonamonadaceae bacterium]